MPVSSKDIEAAVEAHKPAYQAFENAGDVNRLLRRTFEAHFALSGYQVDPDSPVTAYLTAVEKAFYVDEPGPGRLANDDRERVILSLLASQGAVGNLAIHVYLALMEGVGASEIVEVLFLTGIYSGVNRLAQSLKIANVVFLELVAATSTPTVPQLLARIVGQFPEEKALLERLLQGSAAPA